MVMNHVIRMTMEISWIIIKMTLTIVHVQIETLIWLEMDTTKLRWTNIRKQTYTTLLLLIIQIC